MEKNVRIGYWGMNPSGCYWYRIKQPMEMLSRNGIRTREIHINEDVEDIEGYKSFQFYGATPFSMGLIFKYMKAESKKIVYDIDDALDLVEIDNPFYFNVKKDLGSHIQAIQNADEITVSTAQFLEYLKGKTNAKITVIPNCFNPREWTYPRPKREGFRIGFAGSATHVKDLIDIIPVIRKLQGEYDIKFLIMGFGESNYQDWFKNFRYISSPEATELLNKLDKELSMIRFEWIPYVDYSNYPSTLINMALDIGLCPLKDTPFNRCRSACKAMEYTLSGALALASDVVSYQNEPTSILVKEGEWEQTIRYYIDNPKELEKKRTEHLEWIEENRNIQTQLEPLKKVYLT